MALPPPSPHGTPTGDDLAPPQSSTHHAPTAPIVDVLALPSPMSPQASVNHVSTVPTIVLEPPPQHRRNRLSTAPPPPASRAMATTTASSSVPKLRSAPS
ncbi:hypothetical protein E2562_038831 [Oryza meyeriana var. granulata]|uniref:Uncharacterized protein n=1 Tax=Oryza meyeriana var. granulata TaxID=110450 RepID=A0A6G1CMF9_9ORYZ|nr:hypothetical protein E2562_038831 [Oryza meyeriana var. granulata]